MSEVLSVRDVAVDFATGRGTLNAVRGVTLSLEAGESLGIVGESGSGKTVLLRSTMGMNQGSNTHRSGSIVFDGVDISDYDPEQLREIWGTGMAMIFQDPMTALNPVRRIDSQMVEGLRIRMGMSKDDATKRAIELLDLVRIPSPEDVMKKYPNQLSGGMRQRVLIAMALACNPKILFADEPTTALDVTVQAQILELLDEIRERLGMAVVIVTHDLGVAAGHTDKIAVMYAGEVVEYGRTADLFANVRMPYTEALLKSIPRVDTQPGSRLPVIEGRLPDPTRPQPGCLFAARCEYAQDKCRTQHPDLVNDGSGHFYRCHFPLGAK